MTMPERQTLPLLTIQGVSERCGVNAVTLRAWERRYGLIQPERTAKGHRRYTPAQVERVQAIVEWLNKGVPIRQVRDLLDRQADSARPNTESAGDESPTQENGGQGEVAGRPSGNARRLAGPQRAADRAVPESPFA